MLASEVTLADQGRYAELTFKTIAGEEVSIVGIIVECQHSEPAFAVDDTGSYHFGPGDRIDFLTAKEAIAAVLAKIMVESL